MQNSVCASGFIKAGASGSKTLKKLVSFDVFNVM
jgi:hypothetical protein